MTGMKDYQKPDPSVGGGLMSGISFLYPNDAIDLDDRITSLPQDGSVPGPLVGSGCIRQDIRLVMYRFFMSEEG